jgi:hypothetical protein
VAGWHGFYAGAMAFYTRDLSNCRCIHRDSATISMGIDGQRDVAHTSSVLQFKGNFRVRDMA